MSKKTHSWSTHYREGKLWTVSLEIPSSDSSLTEDPDIYEITLMGDSHYNTEYTSGFSLDGYPMSTHRTLTAATLEIMEEARI